MSGAGKKVVDVAFKASKNIDWEGMAKLLVSDEARKEFATLRRAFDEVNTTLSTKFSQVQFQTLPIFFSFLIFLFGYFCKSMLRSFFAISMFFDSWCIGGRFFFVFKDMGFVYFGMIRSFEIGE